MKDRPKITRIAKLKGFDGALAGRDFADIFKDGHVYQVSDIAGEIIFKDLGEHALMDGSSFSSIMMGTYLLTKEENDYQNNKENGWN
jgi:hypothetical protein